jgi:prolyl 4-hydroxylase
MKSCTVRVGFITILLINLVKSEYYSSIDKLQNLFEIETKVLNDFSVILSEFDDIKTYLDKKLLPWIAENRNAKNDENYLANFLNAFLLIKRNFEDLKMVTGKLDEFAHDLKQKIDKIEQKSVITANEVFGAVAGILRAQKAYRLKSEDLVEGIIDGLQTRNPLSPHDIFVFADSVYSEEENAFFLEKYSEIARKKIKNGHDPLNEVDPNEIDKILEYLPEDIPDPFDETYELKTYRERRTDVIMSQKACRGELTRSPKETKSLLCRLVSFSQFSKIAPFKLEEISVEPHLVMYHEVLSDSEIKRLIEIARQNQSKALVGEDGIDVEDDRLAQQMMIYRTHHPEAIDVLNARFEDMTGLTTETADPLLMQNYGVGGHYYSHYDTFEDGYDMDISKSHRMATLMLYVRILIETC